MESTEEIVWSEADLRRSSKSGRTNIRVTAWPDNVRVVSLEGLGLFGIDDKGEVYFDGKRLYTAKRFETVERVIASIGVGAALVAALASAISTGIDILQYWHL